MVARKKWSEVRDNSAPSTLCLRTGYAKWLGGRSEAQATKREQAAKRIIEWR